MPFTNPSASGITGSLQAPLSCCSAFLSRWFIPSITSSSDLGYAATSRLKLFKPTCISAVPCISNTFALRLVISTAGLYLNHEIRYGWMAELKTDANVPSISPTVLPFSISSIYILTVSSCSVVQSVARLSSTTAYPGLARRAIDS